MKCGYCGYEFQEEEGIKGCGRCGRPNRCHMVRCPRCYYENPQELKVVRKLKKMMGTKKNGEDRSQNSE